MNPITNPHDKFFKEIFTRRSVVRQFLAHYLPPDVVDLLDLNAIEVTKDSFVDPHLKEYSSDLLLKTYFKEDSRGYK